MRYNKVFSAVFFTGALAVLVLGKQGVLNLPGIGAAAVALVLLRFNSFWSMVLGMISATVSFAAQSVVGVCPSCVMAASLFILGSLVLYSEWESKKPVGTFIASVPLVIALLAFAFTTSRPVDAVSGITNDVEKAPAQEEKLLLYYSPFCPHCEEVLNLMIEKDPKGKTWTPVVVPPSMAVQEKKALYQKGYSGEISSAWRSPAGMFPCLIAGGDMYKGASEIQRFLKGGR